jgi:hypothetical protein
VTARDRVAGLAILDPAFVGAVDQDGVVVEITNDFRTPGTDCRITVL